MVLTAWATDGAEVTITWDEVASSAAVVWQQDGRQVVRTGRETVTRVSVSGDGGAVELGVQTGSDGVQGRLVVRVAEQVTVTDSLLRVWGPGRPAVGDEPPGTAPVELGRVDQVLVGLGLVDNARGGRRGGATLAVVRGGAAGRGGRGGARCG